jgi:hypothetical protein
MKHRLLILLLPFAFYLSPCFAQSEVNDEAIRYQQQRMVFQQWDQNKFKPGKGFLDTNPYYWLVWGLFDPNYHKTDLRPLSGTGPQTQRLALVGAMNSTDAKYKLHSDTVRNTALSEIANQSGLLSDADPLWLLYYKQQLNPVINNSMVSILAGLSPQVSAKLVSGGLYGWYKNELDMLKERIQGARTTNMDRGSRIISYYRFLNEYRRLSAVWAVRISSAQMDLTMTGQQQQVVTGKTAVPNWTPNSDVQIATQVLQNAQY